MTEKNCLIVDDSRLSRMMLKKIISDSLPTWNCVEAADGQEAVNLVQNQHFEYVFLDYNMPNMDGGEAAKIIRPLLPDASIAFLTANVQEAIRKMAKELEIDFIPKPITEEKIITYVKSRTTS